MHIFLGVDRGSLRNVLAPFKHLTKEKGVRYALAANFGVSITTPIAKMAIVHGSTELFLAIFFTAVTCVLTPFLLKKTTSHFSNITENFFPLVFVGICNSLFFIFIWMAFKHGPVGLVSAVGGSSSVIFNMFFAGTFLREQGIMKRTIATMIMFIGTLLITLK